MPAVSTIIFVNFFQSVRKPKKCCDSMRKEMERTQKGHKKKNDRPREKDHYLNDCTLEKHRES